jgi:uncharacterized membrane protein (UPF0127 family)
MSLAVKMIMGGLLAVSVLVLFFYYTADATMPERVITINNVSVTVEVADTDVLREQGLSGHAPLEPGKGMLFVFSQDDMWGIWMKDMLFPIDIVWINQEGIVITVAHNVLPESYPLQSFYPTAPARYVLELPAGYSDTYGIAEGVRAVL